MQARGMFVDAEDIGAHEEVVAGIGRALSNQLPLAKVETCSPSVALTPRYVYDASLRHDSLKLEDIAVARSLNPLCRIAMALAISV